MMARSRSVTLGSCAFLLASVAVLTTCVDRSMAGHYRGKRPVSGPPHIAGTLAKVELDLERDGTFHLLNLSVSASGRWRQDGDRIVLEFLRVLDRPASNMRSPLITIKGKALEFVDAEGGDPTAVTLTTQ